MTTNPKNKCPRCGQSTGMPFHTCVAKPDSKLEEAWSNSSFEISALKERVADLQQSLTKANEELVELRKDKERLDWLNHHTKRNCLSSANENTFLVTYFGEPEISFARQAIDFAIAAQEKMK